MDDFELLAKWIWLSNACGAGSRIPDLLLSVFGGVEEIYEATEEEFLELDMDLPCLEELCNKSLDRARYILKWCEQKRVGIITIDDPKYPQKLIGIPDYPIILYYFGRLPSIDKRLSIACVGTRRMTDYGQNNAYTIARDLAKEGTIIVSGLALGIDSVCHRAALDVGGDTIAVLGCGLDRAYPPQNRNLMIEVAKHGAIITEYPPFTEPLKPNFPMRNRIISGLSNATMVFEADEHSGSLITARHAKKQGRPVFALPGNTGNLSSLGTNDLLTNGAHAAIRAGDIIETYKLLLRKDLSAEIERAPYLKPAEFKFTAEDGFEKVPPEYAEAKRRENLALASHATEKADETDAQVHEKISKEKADKLISELSVMETNVMNALSRTDPKTIDQLSSTGYPVNKLLAALTMLEIKKLILPMPGGGYVKIH